MVLLIIGWCKIVKRSNHDNPSGTIIQYVSLSTQYLFLNGQKTKKGTQWISHLLAPKTTIPQLDQGKELDASIRRCLALVNIAENYPPETWTCVYTDGSATKTITDGGAGIIIQYPSGATQTASSATTGKHCTNYRAETEALK